MSRTPRAEIEAVNNSISYQPRRIGLLLLLLLQLGFATTTQASDVLFAVDANFAPYQIDPPDDGLPGFDVEIVRSIFDAANIATQMHFLPWAEAISATKSGQYAGVYSCAHRTDREAHFLFSDTLSRATAGFMMRAGFGGPIPRVISDVKGYRSAGLSENATFKDLQKINPKAVGYPDIAEAISDLIAKKYDYLFTVKQVSFYTALKHSVAEKMVFAPISHVAYHICFSKNWPGVRSLRKQFNTGLKALRANRTYRHIHEKYR